MRGTTPADTAQLSRRIREVFLARSICTSELRPRIVKVEQVSLLPPRSPGPSWHGQNDRSLRDALRRSPADEPARGPLRVGFTLQPWRLQQLELPPLRRTRPPRDTLSTWDIRVRRYTSPRDSWVLPPLLSPLPPSPSTPSCSRSDKETQTLPQSRVRRGTQTSPPRTADRGTTYEWDTTSVGSQTEEERSYTPPGTPPAWRQARRTVAEAQRRRTTRAKSAPHRTDHEAEKYGPVRWTATSSPISWRERKTRRH